MWEVYERLWRVSGELSDKPYRTTETKNNGDEYLTWGTRNYRTSSGRGPFTPTLTVWEFTQYTPPSPHLNLTSITLKSKVQGMSEVEKILEQWIKCEH